MTILNSNKKIISARTHRAGAVLFLSIFFYSQQIIDRNIKEFCDRHQCVQIGLPSAALPETDRLIAVSEPIPEFPLRHAVFFTQILQFFSEIIIVHKKILTNIPKYIDNPT